MASPNQSNNSGSYQPELSVEAGNSAENGEPLTPEELLHLQRLTDRNYFRTSALDLSDWDNVGSYESDLEYQKIFATFIHSEMFSEAQPSSAHDMQHPTVPDPQAQDQQNSSAHHLETLSQGPGSPPPSYAFQNPADNPPALQLAAQPTPVPALQPVVQPMTLAHSEGVFIYLPRYANFRLQPYRQIPATMRSADLVTLLRIAPKWRIAIQWVWHYLRYRLPRRYFWSHERLLDEEILQEFYACKVFESSRSGINWEPGPEFAQEAPGRFLFLGSIDRPLRILINLMSSGYEYARSRYTNAVIEMVYPRMEKGEFGSKEELEALLIDDKIFHLPSVSPDGDVLFGSKIVFVIMSKIFLGARINSIIHHWEGLAGPAPYIPGFTVALAAIYAVLLVRKWVYGDDSFDEVRFRQVYDRALRCWVDMLGQPEELKKFLDLDYSWIYASR